MPGVELIIISTVTEGDSAGLTYPRVVPDAEVRKDLASLRQESGWTLQDVKISKGSVLASGGNQMTSTEFTTSGAVDRRAGGFLIEPIAKALRRHGLIEVVYVVQPPFIFQGLRSFQNKHVSISLAEERDTTYRYRIRILDPNFQRLNLPIIQPVTETATAGEPAGALWPLRVAVAVVAALMAAILIGLVVARRRGAA